MASSGKKKTTMAKLQRESRLRERRAIKAAKKDARKRGAAEGSDAPSDTPPADDRFTPPTEEEIAAAVTRAG